MLEKIEKFQTLIVGLIVVLGVLIAVQIVTSSMKQNTITVTGSAYELVKSDSATMYFEITTKSLTRQTAYVQMQTKLAAVLKYLDEKGIKDVEVKSSNGYYTNKRDAKGNYTDIPESFTMNQPISIRSDDVELVKKISVDISSLANKGIDLSVYSVNYNYSKLGDLKVKLLEEASKDAKNRAISMLKPTGNKVGKIQSVRMGVYQITSVDSTSVSDAGINDTSTIDKKVTAVANVSFKIK